MAKNKETTDGPIPCLKPAFPPAPNRIRLGNRDAERRGQASECCVKDDFRTSTSETRAASGERNPLGLDTGEPAFGRGGEDPNPNWALRSVPQTRARAVCDVRKA